MRRKTDVNFAQNVICLWLLNISEGSIISLWYSKVWHNIICRTILTISRRNWENIQFINKKCNLEPYFCCRSFLCTRVGSCYTRVLSCCTCVVSCCLVLSLVLIVLCCVVLVLSGVVSFCLVLCSCCRVVSCYYPCSFLD